MEVKSVCVFSVAALVDESPALCLEGGTTAPGEGGPGQDWHGGASGNSSLPRKLFIPRPCWNNGGRWGGKCFSRRAAAPAEQVEESTNVPVGGENWSDVNQPSEDWSRQQKKWPYSTFSVFILHILVPFGSFSSVTGQVLQFAQQLQQVCNKSGWLCLTKKLVNEGSVCCVECSSSQPSVIGSVDVERGQRRCAP